MGKNEIERLNNIIDMSNFPPKFFAFTLILGEDDPGICWQRILSAVRIIVSQSAEEWPSDDQWRHIVPVWLRSFMMTAEESDEAMAKTPREQWSQLPWDFGSWLDAIRERDWKWWRGERSGREARIVLEVTGIPPRIDAFKQIVLGAGAVIALENHN